MEEPKPKHRLSILARRLVLISALLIPVHFVPTSYDEIHVILFFGSAAVVPVNLGLGWRAATLSGATGRQRSTFLGDALFAALIWVIHLLVIPLFFFAC